MDKETDVVIIGGGISGCSSAYYLAKRGIEVVLLEKGEIASEGSGRSLGSIRAQARNPVEVPLILESIRLWKGLGKELGSDSGYVQSGGLLYVENEKDLAELELGARISREAGVDSRLLSPREVRALLPELKAPVKGALYSPTDGHGESATGTVAFAEAARKAGARLYTNCAALDIETSNGRVTSVRTDRGRVETPWVVNAAGVWANHLSRMVGYRFPVRIIRMTAGLTERVDLNLKPYVRGPDSALRPTAEGKINFCQGFGPPRDYDVGLDILEDIRIWLPHLIRNRKLLRINLGRELFRSIQARTPLLSKITRPAPFRSDIEPKVNRRSLKEGFEALVRSMPALEGTKIERSWAGLIDVTPDMLPVFGPLPRPEGYIMAAGFSGHGFAIGPITGRLISEIIVDGKPSIPLGAFRPGRFAEGVRISPPRNFVG